MTAAAHSRPTSRSRGWSLLRRKWNAARVFAKRAAAAGTAHGQWMDVAQPLPEGAGNAQTGPPDFVGVGMQRCGTTRWFDLLSTHPEVLGAAGRKELHYFDRFMQGGCTAAQLEQYHRYFPKSRPGKTGEWTPVYAAVPWVAPLLAAAAPEARLLVLLRDPIERYLSGLQHDLERARAFGFAPARLAPLEHLERGFYHTHLLGLLRHFARERVLVLQYERCASEPLQQLRRTFAFLGLQDLDHAPDVGARPRHQPVKPTLDAATRRAYVELYQGEVQRLLVDFPEIDVTLWPNFAHLAS